MEKVLYKLQLSGCFVLNKIARYSMKLQGKIREHILIFFLMLINTFYYIYTLSPISVHLLIKYIIGVIIMGGIIVFSIDREINPIKWKKSIVIPWFLFGGVCLITGFTTSMEYFPFICVWLIGFPILFLVWNNRKDYTTLFKYLYVGFMIPTVIFFMMSIVVVPIGGEAYTGLSNNANSVGFAIGIVWAMLLWQVFYNSRSLINKLFLLMLIGFAFYSQSRTIMVTIIFTTFICIISKMVLGKNVKKMCLTVLALIIGSVLSCMILFGINKFSMLVWPESVANQKEISLEKAAHDYTDRMSGKDKKAEGLNHYSSGRIGIWEEALSKLNIKGHPSSEHIVTLRNGDVGSNIHNIFIQFAYDNGILAGIVYIIMCITAFLITLKKCLMKNNRNVEIYVLLLLIQASYIGIGMFTSINVPFLYTLSFVYYLVFAVLFDKDF